ncbi:hypothetical protein GCM10011346_32740 [Oceanobacillus neutriphilus]|uniref:Uncharacterized protein n=1 Tax=Oceanobacillus neutriphilus TaxID=531815 RepID=A0ABQ2NXU9_9BACI|nr:hypothetical protein GCM10011346_32740 [Oceanobacillus neutriphilus]
MELALSRTVYYKKKQSRKWKYITEKVGRPNVYADNILYHIGVKDKRRKYARCNNTNSAFFFY